MSNEEFMSIENLKQRYLERKELLKENMGINIETYELITKQHEGNKIQRSHTG